MTEQYPVHEEIEAEQGCTIFKSSDWWKAVLLFESYGTQKVGVYLWKKDDSDWKRKQKYTIRSLEDWEQDREKITELVSNLNST